MKQRCTKNCSILHSERDSPRRIKGKGRRSGNPGRNLSKSDEGSASVEFALLAIPLFLPLYLFMNTFAATSDHQNALRTLARESARAFVTSSDDESAFAVASGVVEKGAQLLGIQDEFQEGEISMQINCSYRPCISPDSKITITLSRHLDAQHKVQVSAIEYVSPWA